MSNEILFKVLTPLGFYVHTTPSHWELIVTAKHPVMHGCEENVQKVLQYPDEIRRSRSDTGVYLFYRTERLGRWICVVVKKLNDEAFVITAYPADAIKEGEEIWDR
jgi:hypothetical protein